MELLICREPEPGILELRKIVPAAPGRRTLDRGKAAMAACAFPRRRLQPVRRAT